MENNQEKNNEENDKEKNIDNKKVLANTFKDKGDYEELDLLTSPKKKETNNNNEPTFTIIPRPKPEILNNNRKGNMLMICYNKQGVPLIVLGPNRVLAFMMAFIIDIISISYLYFFRNLLFKFIHIIGIILFIVQSISYLITILMNPGIPTKDLYLENYKHLDEIGTYRICNICKIIMRNDDNTDHCDECNICIVGADHHCPWTSKCVGKNNKKMFYLFVYSTFSLLIYFIIGAFTLIVNIDEDKNEKKY